MIALSQRFEVRRRFHRSVHLAADAGRDDACDGYVLTGVGRATLGRMLDALANGGSARAWSLTGPYGAGKSAFVVLLAQLLGRPHRDARVLLRAVDGGGSLGELLSRARGERAFTTLLITATYGPLVPSILDAVEQALRGRRGARVDRLLAEIQALRGTRGRSAGSHRRLVALVTDLAELSHDGRGGGLLIVLDELGKALEHAGRGDARTDDVFLLQELAELAARSRDAPVVLVTLLHQSFDRYAQGLAARTRAEWAKVQGRFSDVAFLDAPSELLRVAARSIHRTGTGTAHDVFARFDARAQEAFALGIADGNMVPLLAALAPLHPTVALVLPALFRGPLAQNERSLFDFLTSRAPGSFGEFIETHDATDAPAYTLDRLYDLLAATLGPARLLGPEARRWAAIDGALSRLGEESHPLTAPILKAVGLLTILGSKALRASRETLRFALPAVDGAAFDGALNALCEGSHIVYRRHSDAYAIWEGSDVDLEKLFDEARRSAPAIESLSDRLREQMVLRPRVARRHFIETGTLRYFDVALATPEGAALDEIAVKSGADGRIVYLLPAGEESPRDLVRFALDHAAQPEVVVGVPEMAQTLVSLSRDWCAWDAVRAGCRELDGDSVAKRELAVRMHATSAALEAAITACFGVGDEVSVSWVRCGALQPWVGARGVTWGLSAVCDEVFADAPRLRNELLNRRVLSSAAAAARRALLDAMITSGHITRLGIEGAPPEWSMYASLLAEGGLHRERDGAWGFGPPPSDDPLRLLPAWRVIEAFLDESDGCPRPLRALFDTLGRRPIGLREGPAPVLFFAVVLASPGEVAIFEDGTFVTDLSGAVIERLLRRIDHFMVARYRVTGARLHAVSAVQGIVGSERATPVDVVRALVRGVMALPRSTRSTRRIGPRGLAAREAITTARDPLRLLFVDLPTALGLTPVGPEEDGGMGAVSYAIALSDALGEIRAAYPSLLATVEIKLAKGLGFEATNLREAFTANSVRLLGVVVDLRLRALLGRAALAQVPYQEWIEGVAMVVLNRPPSDWSDSDLARFELGIEEFAALMRRAESLAAHLPPTVSVEDAPLVDEAEREILRVLEARSGARREVWLAALGRTIRRLMDNAPDGGATDSTGET